VLRWVRERQPFTLLREEPAADDGGPGEGPGSGQWPVFVYALRDERELVPWLLTWGRSVEVLEPASLRAALAAEARALLARHEPSHEQAVERPARAAAPTPAT
jgi:hypothetical protein